jgi:hypothetical protein
MDRLRRVTDQILIERIAALCLSQGVFIFRGMSRLSISSVTLVFLTMISAVHAQHPGPDTVDYCRAEVTATSHGLAPATTMPSLSDSLSAFVHIPPYDGSLSDLNIVDSAPASASDALPDDPKPANPPADHRAQQTKRILGIIPNFRAVSTDEKLPPQSVKEKFITTTQDSFDYSSVVIPLLLAGYSMGTDATPEFHQGAAGYGRYFWHAAVDQTSENYMVEFFVPVLTHEDSRYYTLGRGGFIKRTGYAASRAVVTRSDSGKNVFNVSEVVGAGASAGLSTLYYPTRERSFANTGTEWGLDVGIDAITFVLKEFWPDINHSLFHGDKQ